MPETQIEILVIHHGNQPSYSFSCPYCRFHNSWGKETTAYTKIGEHLSIKHQKRISIPRSESPTIVRRSGSPTLEAVRKSLEDAARKILKERGGTI